MGYSIERKPDAPVVVVSFAGEFSPQRHLPQLIDEIRDLLDSSGEPIHYITDTREASVSFADIVQGLARVTRGASGIFTHPQIHKLYFVAKSELIQFAVKALAQAQYGGRQAIAVDSLEEALTLIEQELASSAA